MKALVCEGYGPPEAMELRDVPEPEVNDDTVLIKVKATSVNRSDWETLTGSPFYARMGSGVFSGRSRILGSDVAGRVVAVGRTVTRFRVDDEVFGDLMYHGGKCFAEYVAVSEKAPIVSKPRTVSFEKVAALPQTGLIAVQGLETRGGLQEGENLLINGAGGGSGTLAIQIAKRFGAEVTGVDNTHKLETMRAAGADHVIDYLTDDYTKQDKRYDRILDLVASHSVFANRRVLAPGGVYRVVGGPVRRLLSAATLGQMISMVGEKSLGVLLVSSDREDLEFLAKEVEEHRLDPVIDRIYDLSETPEALRRLGDNKARGKLVIRVS